MKTLSYTQARACLSETMENVIQNHEEVIITRNKHASVVMLSLEDYESLQETCYLLKSPANAKRLFDSIYEVENNLLSQKNLNLLEE